MRRLDHSKYLKEYLSLGIQTYSNKSVVDKFGGETYNFKSVEALKTFQVGNFKVMAFDCQHDVQTFGFLIEHPECGKVLFATDTYYIKYKFKGLNNIIIETNYSKKIINEKISSSGISSFLKDRIYRSHFSLENAVEFLKSNDLSEVCNICLIHLSSSNSNELEFKKEVERNTKKDVFILDKGITLNFDKYPF